jgi:DNA-binding CsgD family transcriptional regulator
VRTLTRKLKENEREMEETIMKGKANESLAERAKM